MGKHALQSRYVHYTNRAVRDGGRIFLISFQLPECKGKGRGRREGKPSAVEEIQCRMGVGRWEQLADIGREGGGEEGARRLSRCCMQDKYFLRPSV